VACQPVDAERREQAVKHGVDREVGSTGASAG
jgi:hypothetical protein